MRALGGDLEAGMCDAAQGGDLKGIGALPTRGEQHHGCPSLGCRMGRLTASGLRAILQVRARPPAASYIYIVGSILP